jgi:arylsulfatase A-like enzyme
MMVERAVRSTLQGRQSGEPAMMERREFLKVASLGAVGATIPGLVQNVSLQNDAVEKPNIVFVVSDQHRAGLTKASGYPLDTSPMRDRLAAGGVSFDRAYCTSPLCVPSRISMLTGRWPDAHRIRSNDMAKEAIYTKHLYQVAKENGYKTGLAGKNHTFLTKDDLDFWREYGLASGWMPPNPPDSYVQFDKWMKGLHANVSLEPTPFPLEVQFPYRIVSDAMEFIDSAGDQPFILQVGFSEPHDPEQVPAPYWNMFPPERVPDRYAGPEALQQLGYRAQWEFSHQEASFHTEENWRRYKSNYLGMLRLIDDQLARLVEHLQEKNLIEKTILVFLADHGDYLMDYGLARKGVGLPECLTRIPMVWTGPGIRPSNVGSAACVSMADLLPTLCEAIGTPIPEGVQGRSLWPLLQGKDYPKDEFRSAYAVVGVGGLYYEASDNVPFRTRAATQLGSQGTTTAQNTSFDELNKVSQSGIQKMVRMGDWKLIFDMMGYGQLYNLKDDPGELKNLFGRRGCEEAQSALLAELLMWSIRTEDSLPTGPQGEKWQTKWPAEHNWYAPYRKGTAPVAFVP